MRVLIIGTGYIGLPLGKELARQGHTIFGLRRNIDAAAELEATGIRPVIADITKPEELAQLPRDFDWVVNCVASGGRGAEDYRRVYFEGMRNVIDWLAPDGCRDIGTPRILYTSSTSVYGQNDGLMVDELSPTEPVAETARVLLQTEKALLDAGQQRNFPALILRVAGIYGPGRGYWFRQFLNGEARIEGKGERILNMIHRDDVVGCIIAALEHGQSGSIYNAADDEPVSQLDFFSWLATFLDKPLPGTAPANVESARKRGVSSKKVLNLKLKAELRYQFKYPTFREGMSAIE